MEKQYLDLINMLIKKGERRETRSGTVYASFGHTIEHDLAKGFPLLTTKKMFFRGIVEELSWFLRGSTDVQELRDKYTSGMEILKTENMMQGQYMGFNGVILVQNMIRVKCHILIKE